MKYTTIIVWEAPDNLSEAEVFDMAHEELVNPLSTPLSCIWLETTKN